MERRQVARKETKAGLPFTRVHSERVQLLRFINLHQLYTCIGWRFKGGLPTTALEANALSAEDIEFYVEVTDAKDAKLGSVVVTANDLPSMEQAMEEGGKKGLREWARERFDSLPPTKIAIDPESRINEDTRSVLRFFARDGGRDVTSQTTWAQSRLPLA